VNRYFKVSRANSQDKESLNKREMDKYDGNSVISRMSADSEAV